MGESDDRREHRHSSRSERRNDDDRHRSSDRYRHRHHRSHGHSSRSHDGHSNRKRRRHDDERDHHRDERHRHRHRSDRDHHDRSRRDDAKDHMDSKQQDKQPAVDFIPTAESLQIVSQDDRSEDKAPSSGLKRDDWMMGSGGDDADEATFFSSLGKARVKAPRPEKPDPEKLKVSSRELNSQLREGKTVDEYATPSGSNTRAALGAPGYQWRMMKLKRTLEAAEQSARDLNEVALERYASLEEFEHAQAERRFLDNRPQAKDDDRSVRSTPTLQSVARRSYLLASGSTAEPERDSARNGTDSPAGGSRPASRQGFRRPGESSNPSTPTPTTRPPRTVGFETPTSKPTTPSAIPSVFTPVIERPPETQPGVVIQNASDSDRPVLSADELNKLQAKIVRAELMGDGDLDALRAEYERETARASTAPSPAVPIKAGVLTQDGERELQVLPTLDARGRMYDVGSLNHSPQGAGAKAKRRLRGRDEFEARDSKTGQIVRYGAEDDQVSLGDLVRAEKLGAGSRWDKEADAEMAANIMADAGFSADLEAQDDEAHRYAKKKMRADAVKRQFAIGDYARTQKALDRCRFCWQDEGAKPPRAVVVSSGYRAYLAVPEVEAITERAEDHVLIVPMQHHLSLLEADDDTWDELRNFQKCLIQLAASRGQRVVFFETLLSIKHQRHAVMEAVLLPSAAMDLLPGVFKQSLRQMGGEFSTNAKVIEFTPARSFRNALVPNLPYFAVAWDHRWATGYGHVIENLNPTATQADAYDVDEMAAGSNNAEFSDNFARDVIRATLEDLDADNEGGSPSAPYVRSFGKSKHRNHDEKLRTRETFRRGWNQFDWTKQIPNQPS
ncbi:hypothetical protein PaG_00696 [Moesziomyces aphidis]|uniref:Cwf19-like C-terminal domain-containing protein n=1 Tax=Moesziomyces aphidis TaxID=84754 RepID=W3VVG1_MOEAP|nr:hypothetical protein PaG_00696 [Moesziomyces aphidis]